VGPFPGWLERIYTDFRSKVAEGRKLPKEKVLELAKGRIWSGEDAKALGLIDEVGGYGVGLKLAKQAAKIPEAEDVSLKVFPARKELLEKLLEGPAESSEKAAVAAWVRVTEALRPVIRKLQALGLWDQPGVLSMPAPPANP
jgi:protease-4